MHLPMPAIELNYDGFVAVCNASQVPMKGGWFLKDLSFLSEVCKVHVLSNSV